MTPLFRLAAVLFSAVAEFDAQAMPVEMVSARAGAIDALWGAGQAGHGPQLAMAVADAPAWVLEYSAAPPTPTPVTAASWTQAPAYGPGMTHAAYKPTAYTLRTQAIAQPVPEPPQYELLLMGLAMLLLGGLRNLDASPWEVVKVGQA